MLDQPTPDEIISAVQGFLRAGLGVGGEARAAFQAKVCVNSLEIVRRHLSLGPDAEAKEHGRLINLLGHDGSLFDLNTELCALIADGRMDLNTPGLADHLWATTLAKLAVDQPSYAAYRAVLAERGHQES